MYTILNDPLCEVDYDDTEPRHRIDLWITDPARVSGFILQLSPDDAERLGRQLLDAADEAMIDELPGPAGAGA